MSGPETRDGEGRLPDLAVALGCWVGASAMLVGVGHAAAVGAGDDVVGDVVTPAFGQGTWWGALAVLTCQAAVLLGARRAPRGTLVGVAAAVPVLAALGAGDATSFGVLAVLVAAYTATVRVGGVRAAPVLGAAVALVGVGSALGNLVAGVRPGLAWTTGLLQAVVSVGLPAAVGLFVLARREARAARADRLVALGREHDALVQVALSRERMAMARELHDIAAHHLTGIAVMSGVLERQIDVAPDDAKVAVRQVRAQSTAMLREMRGLVGLLRDPGAGSETPAARVETIAGIPALVDAAAGAGTDVRLTVRGGGGTLDARTPVAVGPLAQLAAYRTVQECLSNAARHAPGARCEVVVDLRDPAQVVLTVRNDAPPRAPGPQASGGFGLVGMRERAELTDARLAYGPTDDGGWLVTLTIPAGTPSQDDEETPR